jgi:hypothetical protein
MRMQMIVNANLLNVRKCKAQARDDPKKESANRKLEIFFISMEEIYNL